MAEEQQTENQQVVLNEKALNHIIQFLSPTDAIAFTRTCRFVHENSDLGLAKWSSFLTNLQQKLNSGKPISKKKLPVLLTKTLALAKESINSLPEEQQHKLRDFLQQINLTDSNATSLISKLLNITGLVLRELTGDPITLFSFLNISFAWHSNFSFWNALPPARVELYNRVLVCCTVLFEVGVFLKVRNTYQQQAENNSARIDDNMQTLISATISLWDEINVYRSDNQESKTSGNSP